MNMISRLVSNGFALAFSAAAATEFVKAADNDDAEASKTWEEATVFVPGKVFTTTPAGISVDKPLPVVIYLHGCKGISGDHDLMWGQFVRDLGFIAVFPNGMARRGRELDCDPGQAHEMRLEEIRFAVEQVRRSPWAMSRNIFLMGHSEGGIAAARSSFGGFRGVIISGWSCTDARRRKLDRIHVPLETPVLALQWNRDPWLIDHPNEGECADKFGGRKNLQQVILSGAEHGTYHQYEAREAVARFLRTNLSP